jgi:uncharacterized protein
MRVGGVMIVVGDFEWDERKEAANRRKHGVTFIEAMTAFLDERGLVAPDKEHAGRFVLIGMSRELRVLFDVRRWPVKTKLT